MAATAIKKLAKNYASVIFPGMTHFDVSAVEKAIHAPCFKGPVHASDIVKVVKSGVKLSKKEPADLVMEKSGVKEYNWRVRRAELGKADIVIGGTKLSRLMPPRILAEIVDAPLLSDKQVLERAQYYIDSGADMIDVGAIAGDENTRRLGEIVKLLKSKLKVPVSIDSLNPKEINAAIVAGADLVLSLDSKNMKSISKSLRKSDNVAYVVIPDAQKSLKENLAAAQKLGFRDLIADPILRPPFGIAHSISDYFGIRKFNKSVPMMMGASNVVELMDADSVGINALLAAIAVELGVSLLLMTENSEKTRNSVREMKRAIGMCFLAKSKGCLPKDLGFDLLLAKSKRGGGVINLSGVNVVTITGDDTGFVLDSKGYFKIHVDFKKGVIIAAHYKDETTDFVFEGKSAEAISKKIIKSGMVSSLEHAAYVGRELERAELYLRLKKNYVQDEAFLGL